MARGKPASDALPGVASLPMYDWPEVHHANDAVWAAFHGHLRRAGIAAPVALSRNSDPQALWVDPDLVLSQSCGYPYAKQLYSRVSLIGTPAYAIIGAKPGHYFSVLVTRKTSPRPCLARLFEQRFAYNMAQSQSGFAAPLRLLAASGFTSQPEPLETGSHRASIRAVADGEADWAAIDAVTWELAKRHETAAAGLAVFAKTPQTPALPLISGLQMASKADAVSSAIALAIKALDPEIRNAVFLSDLVPLTTQDYAPLAAPLPIATTLPGFHSLPDKNAGHCGDNIDAKTEI